MTLAQLLTLAAGCLVALLVLWFPLRLLVDQAGRELGNALSMQNLALRQRVIELERVRWLPIEDAPLQSMLMLRCVTVDGDPYVQYGLYDVGYEGDPQTLPIPEGWTSIHGDRLIPTHFMPLDSLLALETT